MNCTARRSRHPGPCGRLRHEVAEFRVDLPGQLFAGDRPCRPPQHVPGGGEGCVRRGVAHDVEGRPGRLLLRDWWRSRRGRVRLELEGQALAAVGFGDEGLEGFAGPVGLALLTCTRALDRGRAHAGLVEAGHGAFEVADGGLGLGGVAALPSWAWSRRTVFGSRKSEYLPCARPRQAPFGGLVVAGLDGELAQAAQAPDPVGDRAMALVSTLGRLRARRRPSGARVRDSQS